MNEKQQTKITVYGLVKNEKGEVLILQRAPHDSMGGLWEFPGGGLEFGEHPKEGVGRELLEECGIDVKVDEPLHITSYLTEKDGGQRQILRIVYACHLRDREEHAIVLSPDHIASQWVIPSQLPANLPYSEFLTDTVKHLKERSAW